MKKFVANYLLTPIALFVVFNFAILSILSWTGSRIEEDIIKNISIAKEKYPGTAEDALISFLLDPANSFHDRSHVAIWTLGQIKSQKALPYLRELSNNDPSGVTCKGRHNSVLCQSVIYKAITAIESDWKLHSEFNK